VAESTDPASSGDAVGRRTFSTSFRGFDQTEVRAYLRVLAGEFSALRARVAELEAELSDIGEQAPAPPVTLDIATVTSALGEETARVLRTAQEAAEDLRTRAEEGAARTLKEAHEEAARTLKEAQEEAEQLRKEAQEESERLKEAAETVLRERTVEADQKVAAATEEAAALHSAAEQVLSDRTAEAEASASAILEEAAQAAAQVRAEAEEASARVRKEAEEASARLRNDAETQTAAAIAKAVEQGRDMVGQARAARERVLSDLARRRKVAVNQVELLRSGRERLQASVEAARAESERILEDLRRSDEEAKRATEQAARQTPNSPALGPSGGDGADYHDEEADQDGAGLDESGGESGVPAHPGSGAAPPEPSDSTSDVEEASAPLAEVSVAGEGEPVPDGPTGSDEPAPAQPADGQEGATGAGPVAPMSTAGTSGANRPAASFTAGGPPAGDRPSATPEPAGSRVADVDLTAGADVDLRVPSPPSPPAPAPPSAESPAPVAPARTPYPHDPVPDAELPPGATGAPPGRVDQLFARIRADRAPKGGDASVRGAARPAEPASGRPRGPGRNRPAAAQPAAAQPGAAPVGESGAAPPAPHPTAVAATVATESVSAAAGGDEDPGLEAPRSDEDESYLQRRDAMVEAPLARAVRTARRAFADDQNAALDRFRTLRPANRTVDAVLGEQSAQVEALAAKIAPALADGAAAGARLGGGDGVAPPGPGLVAPVAERLAVALIEPLRRRLADLFDDSDERGSATVDRLNGVYREWRGRIEGAVGDAMTEAVSAGFGAVVADGSPVRWVVEDVGGPCADCDDNALAGESGFGSAFPTGQVSPPAHPGCRCVLARAAT